MSDVVDAVSDVVDAVSDVAASSVFSLEGFFPVLRLLAMALSSLNCCKISWRTLKWNSSSKEFILLLNAVYFFTLRFCSVKSDKRDTNLVLLRKLSSVRNLYKILISIILLRKRK